MECGGRNWATGETHLARPTLVRARAQPVTDHLLEPAGGRLGLGPLCVAGGFLPGRLYVPSHPLRMPARCVGAVSASVLRRSPAGQSEFLRTSCDRNESRLPSPQ